jgi:hypothetical protein
MQKEMNLMGIVSTERINLPWDHIACCDTAQAAARMCIRRAKVYRTRENLADLLKVNKSHFNTMLSADNGKRVRNMPLELIEDLQDLCGNNAINQWQQLYRTRQLNCQKTVADEETELLERLAEIRARKSA